MVTIKKGNTPQELIEYQKTPGASYSGMPKPVKDKVREALLRDQGHVCAYCMKRIPETDKDILAENHTGMKIEHINPQHKKVGDDLDYQNMIATCCGKEKDNESHCLTNDKALRHCDTSKGSNDITLNPLNPEVEPTIYYTSENGKIFSLNQQWNRDLTEENKLNLNIFRLSQNRKSALDGLINIIKKGKVSNSNLHRKLNELSQPGELKPAFYGIIKFFLSNYLSKRKT